MATQDYPRMMFHRSGLVTVINSREEEDKLGREWSRTVWPVASEGLPPAADPPPEPPSASAVPETHAASGETGDPPDAPHPSWAPDESPQEPIECPQPVKPPTPAHVKRKRAATVLGKVKRKFRE